MAARTDRQDGTDGRGDVLSAHAHGLDAIRLFAAFAVAFFHLTWTYPPLAGALPVGWVGVQIFFVLSGIVIAGSAERADTRSFVMGRALRLYPAAWVCGILSIAAMVASDHAQRAVGVGGQLGFGPVVSSFTLIGQTFITSAYWSLPVEIAFYVLVAALVAMGWVRHLGWLATGLIVWSAGFMAIHAAASAGWLDKSLLQSKLLDLGYGLKNVLLLRQGQYFGLGILLFLSLRHGFRRHAPMMALAVVTSFAELHWRAAEMTERSGRQAETMLVFGAAAAIWLIALLLMARAISPGGWRFVGPRAAALRALGLATYPFYLLHEAVGGSVMGLLIRQGLPPVPSLMAALTATLALSLLVAQAAEPALRQALRARLPVPRPA